MKRQLSWHKLSSRAIPGTCRGPSVLPSRLKQPERGHLAQLTEEGEAIVADIAARHVISGDAAMHMLMAVSAGHGTQAQFNQPELVAIGQWSLGGMTMVGDMFNNGQKARVDTLCTELSGIVQQHRLFAVPVSSQSQSQGGTRDVSGDSLFVQESSD
ncbi:hypothetical protein R5H30_19705 [Sulfitobacter sp. D35]|uniref:hypothetical protein n=1 Tax=Sulfitobacter sp. D35 TaxID=3083252 RepID=UPI00296EAAA6|nr:hypothetical protein [Sulfitobacter sp. D35]MDW4500223.1 hypothetical protein [Sulfitobacter sp. D35]